jgi:mono/diheme cytochrome c family protein
MIRSEERSAGGRYDGSYGSFGIDVGAALVGSANAQSDLVKRGDYLVNGILTCGNCHSPKGPPAAIAGKDFSGGLSWDEPPFKVTAPNITPDKETGIGTWTDAQIKTLMRTGIRPNDVHVAMIMPTGFYHVMTDPDLDAVVAYLRTLKPVSNRVADPIYKMPQLEIVIPGGEEEVHRRHDERQGQERLLSRHDRALHGVPHAHGEG